MTSMKRKTLLLFLFFSGKYTLTLKYSLNKHLLYAYPVKGQCGKVTEKIQTSAQKKPTRKEN